MIAASVSGVPRLRQPVGMKAVDEPIEDRVRDEVGIVEADLQARQRLLPLTIDLLRRERRMPRHVRQHPQAGVEAVLHDDDIDEGQVGAGAGAHGAADEVDRVVAISLRRFGRRCPDRAARRRGWRGRACPADPALRRRGRSCRMLTTGCSWCSTATTCRPLSSVRISYGGNCTSRAGSGRGGGSDGQDRCWRGGRGPAPVTSERNGCPSSAFIVPPLPTVRPGGMIVSTIRFSGGEIGARHALHVGGGDVLEDFELAVGGRDVVVNHHRVRRAAAPSAGSTRGPGCSRARTGSWRAAARAR